MNKTAILMTTMLAALVAMPAAAVNFGAPNTALHVSSQTMQDGGKLTAYHTIMSHEGERFWGVLTVTVNGVELDAIAVDTDSMAWSQTDLGDVSDVRSIRIHLRGQLLRPGREAEQVDEYRVVLFRQRATVGPSPIMRALPLPGIPTGPL